MRPAAALSRAVWTTCSLCVSSALVASSSSKIWKAGHVRSLSKSSIAAYGMATTCGVKLTHPSVSQDCASDGNALPLPTAELPTGLAHRGLIPSQQRGETYDVKPWAEV